MARLSYKRAKYVILAPAVGTLSELSRAPWVITQLGNDLSMDVRTVEINYLQNSVVPVVFGSIYSRFELISKVYKKYVELAPAVGRLSELSRVPWVIIQLGNDLSMDVRTAEINYLQSSVVPVV